MTKQSGFNSAPVYHGKQSVTRSGALVSITQACIAERGLPATKFAEALAEAYFAAVPEGARRLPLKVPDHHGDADEYYKAHVSNATAVRRYLEGAVPIPVELEEIWVGVLPQPYRDRAVFELCARFNVLPVLISAETDIHALADLMRSEAAMIEALAPVLADGQINEDDREAALEAIPRVQKAMSDCAGLLARLEKAAGVASSGMTVVGAGRGGRG